MFFVHLLRCSDGSFYTGFCHDLEGRLAAHRNGTASTWTARRRPVELVHFETFPTLTDAVARERQVKSWSHAKKDALVRGDRDLLRSLSKRRTETSLARRPAVRRSGAPTSPTGPVTPAA
jgi:predicted GIY-YIG superfamily endonuclease